MEKWNTLFPNGSPDANRDKTSKTSDAITNPLSEVSGLDNKYTSTSPVPTGRKSQAISVLWHNWCGVGGDSDASLNHLTVAFGNNERLAAKKKDYVEGVSKNVTVRKVETDAIEEVTQQQYGKTHVMTEGVPAVLASYTKQNYRLAAANPEGLFSNFTGKPMTNGGEDIATISLQQYRDGMG